MPACDRAAALRAAGRTACWPRASSTADAQPAAPNSVPASAGAGQALEQMSRRLTGRDVMDM